MRRANGVGAMVRWAGLTVALGAVLGGCDKPKPAKKTDRALEHRAGIPVIPRGKVVLATAKGERYLLEIHARMPINQAVAFYRTQLARENWTDLRIQQVQAGLWGLACRRGMFELTGRIKTLKQGKVSIGFERTVRRKTGSWTPPVRKDVPVLAARVQWNDRVFEAPGSRVELRGRSAHSPQVLHAAALAALKSAGWTVAAGKAPTTVTATRSLTRKVTPEQHKAVTRKLQGEGWTVRVGTDRQTLQASRRLTYHFQAVGKGASVRLQLSYEEVQSATRPRPRPKSGATPSDPRAAPAANANLVRLPGDLVLWSTPEPIYGVKQSDDLHSFSLTRGCTSADKLLGEVVSRLRKRGWKGLGAIRQPTTSGSGSSTRSATLTKGKRAVVIIVAPDTQDCIVRLTVLRKAR